MLSETCVIRFAVIAFCAVGHRPAYGQLHQVTVTVRSGQTHVVGQPSRSRDIGLSLSGFHGPIARPPRLAHA